MPVNATITRLNEERQSQVDFIDQLTATVEGEARDLVDAERQNIGNAEKRIADIDAQIEPLAAFERRRAAAVVVSDLGRAPSRQPGGITVETRSLGQLWTESEEYRNYRGHGTSGQLVVPEFRAVGPDPLLTNTVPGSVLLPKAQKQLAPTHFRAYPLLTMVSTVEVSSNAVEIVTIGDATGADVVAEGAQKPPVVWTASSATVTLQTVAGWFKYSRQSLRDIPGLRDLVDQKIRRAIDTKLNGLAVAAVNSAFTGGNTTTGAAGVSLVSLIRGAVGTLQARGVTPNAVLVHPADAAAIDIAMLSNPGGGGMVVYGAYWGLTVIPSIDVTQGTAIVGDIADAVTYFHKLGLSLYTTDSDVTDGSPVKSDFRANILTTLGEVFGLFAVTDASVLQKVVATP